jgi:hypothetical protein
MISELIDFVVDEESGMTEERRKKIAVFLPRFKELVETLKRVHVAVFYFTGTSIEIRNSSSLLFCANEATNNY